MGEASDENRVELRSGDQSIVLNAPTPLECLDWLVAAFNLTEKEQLSDLLDELLGHASRDQYLEFDDMSDRRREGRRLAKRIARHGAKMRIILDELSEDYVAWHQVVQWSPVILEEIFAVDLSDSQNLFLPSELEILQQFFDGSEFWDKADGLLRQLEQLPIRSGTTGPVGNVTLRKCLRKCRTYWVDIEGRNWSVGKLAYPEIRKADDPANLTGKCELFVTNVLKVAGVQFDLGSLNNAWIAIDSDT